MKQSGHLNHIEEIGFPVTSTHGRTHPTSMEMWVDYNNTRGCRTEYVPGHTDQSKTLYEVYESNPFDTVPYNMETN